MVDIRNSLLILAGMFVVARVLYDFLIKERNYLMVIKEDGANRINLTIYSTEYDYVKRMYINTGRNKFGKKIYINLPTETAYVVETADKKWAHGRNKYRQINLAPADYVVFENEILVGEAKETHIMGLLEKRRQALVADTQWRILEDEKLFGGIDGPKELAKDMATDVELEVLNYLYELIQSGLSISTEILKSFPLEIRNTYFLMNTNKLGKKLRQLN